MTNKQNKITLKIKLIFLVLLASVASIPAWGCSSLLVGKNASTDGSTMITYAADAHVLYGELYQYPAADHKKGDMREVREWDSNKHLGYIPEIAHTYSIVGNMNEHQLSISESTWGGRKELCDTTGIIDYGSLIYIALQRAKTAREAIEVMTSLVEKYGYYSSGESFSIADPNEIWIMELIGKGNTEKGAVWVAMRIPDDCIAGHANHSRIHKFPLKDKNNCIYSKDVITFARRQGYYKGKDEDFSFSKTYAETDFGALRGCDARVWAYYNKFADGMEKFLPWINGKEGSEVLPLYVKPRKKLTVKDVKWMMRDHFENTPFDMTKDIGAGAWKVPYRYRPMTFVVDSVEYTNERAIATQQTGFSFVAQMRSWLPDAIGGTLWFGVDDANTSIYIPMYCAMTKIPESYAHGNGDLYTLSWTSAFWVNNFVANQAYNRYSLMIPDIRKVQSAIEDDLETNQKSIEDKAIELYKQSPGEAIAYLNDYSATKANDATSKYRKLGEYLLVKFLDGNMKKEKDGEFQRSAEGYPVTPFFPGYDERYYRSIVDETGDHLKVTK
ncbi:MAG: C69 family dipeptidase [Muribaculaceae bacterium]|nr:C69 family dipeptidase [Muribaculaceae bacterium]